MKWVAVCLMFVLGLCMARTAAAEEALAVLITVDGDPALSDNLAEVVISKLSETEGRRLVGSRELRARIPGLETCLAEARCLAQVAASAGTNLGVIGNVRRADGRFHVDLALVDLTTAIRQKEVAQSTAEDVESLIGAVQACVEQLFASERTSSQPPLVSDSSAEVEVGDASPAPAKDPLVQPAPLRRDEGPTKPSRQTAKIIAYSAAVASVLALSAATVTGLTARAAPRGATRAEAQADLEKRQDWATATNVLLGAGAGLAVVATVAFVWP